MEVIVNSSAVGSQPFLLKVDDLDSVGKIKEKIEKHHGIPTSSQTICFNDEILPDDFNVRGSQIVDGSTLLLRLNNQPLPAAGDADLHFLNDVDLNLSLLDDLLKSPTHSNNDSPTSILHESPAKISSAATSSTKEIMQKELINVESDGNSNLPEVVVYKQAPASWRPTMTVVVRHHGRQTGVRVRRDEAVSALRGRLRKMGFGIPEPCFFIHGQKVMEDDQSFASNAVAQGDVIEAFAGYYR